MTLNAEWTKHITLYSGDKHVSMNGRLVIFGSCEVISPTLNVTPIKLLRMGPNWASVFKGKVVKNMLSARASFCCRLVAQML